MGGNLEYRNSGKIHFPKKKVFKTKEANLAAASFVDYESIF